MRHTSFLLVTLLLGCSGTPVSTPIVPKFPQILPPPNIEQSTTKELNSVLAYRDAIDRYISYLKDYSNRIANDHGLKATHEISCPTLVHAGSLVIPPPPITMGLDETQTVDALIEYIADLRGVMLAHNRALAAAKDNVEQVCKTIR